MRYGKTIQRNLPYNIAKQFNEYYINIIKLHDETIVKISNLITDYLNSVSVVAAWYMLIAALVTLIITIVLSMIFG